LIGITEGWLVQISAVASIGHIIGQDECKADKFPNPLVDQLSGRHSSILTGSGLAYVSVTHFIVLFVSYQRQKSKKPVAYFVRFVVQLELQGRTLDEMEIEDTENPPRTAGASRGRMHTAGPSLPPIVITVGTNLCFKLPLSLF